jgi:hypothetical protein
MPKHENCAIHARSPAGLSKVIARESKRHGGGRLSRLSDAHLISLRLDGIGFSSSITFLCHLIALLDPRYLVRLIGLCGSILAQRLACKALELEIDLNF